MSYDTLALTMQMQCPLEGVDPDDFDTRHRVNADGITGSAPGEIFAVCGASVYLPLGDDCPRDAPTSDQWGKPWDGNERDDRDWGVGWKACPRCLPQPAQVFVSSDGETWDPFGDVVQLRIEPDGTTRRRVSE